MTHHLLIQLSFLTLMAGTSLRAQGTLPTETGQDATQTSSAAAPMALSSPKAPKVTCDENHLTISANNSTLRSVLAAVHTCIGVQIDFPDGSDGGRTFEQLGPGPVRQVLTSLLSGTEFNYVIGSSEANPQKVETVVLMRRTTGADASGASSSDYIQTPARRAWARSREVARPTPPESNENPPAVEEQPTPPTPETSAAATADTTSTSSADVSTSNATTAPASSDTAVPSASPSAESTDPTTPSIVTPSTTNLSSDSGKATEDRITDMQRLFEQRRKMTESQNPTSP
jgi:hypothetical protein